MDDTNRKIVICVVLLIALAVFSEVVAPKIGSWAVWSGRVALGLVVTYMAYNAMGGEGFGRLLFAFILVFGLGGLAIAYGPHLMSALDSLARVAMPILVLIDLVSGFVDIVAGVRSGSRGLMIAGAIAGLMALSSAPAIEEPTATSLIMSVLGTVVGVGAFLKRGATNAFG